MLGTSATTDVELQLSIVAATPPNVTVLEPCCNPKLLPVRVIWLPEIPNPGDRFEITGVSAGNANFATKPVGCPTEWFGKHSRVGKSLELV